MSDIATQGKNLTFAALMQSSLGQLQAALPKHLTPERMIRTALTAFRQQPKLAECEPRGVLACVFVAAQLGLEIGVNGEAYLLPFWNNQKRRYDSQLIVGFQGYMKLARQSGQILSIEARVVYEGDVFELEYGIPGAFRHVPDLQATSARNPIMVYSIARFTDGGHHIEVMNWWQVMAIKDRTKSRTKEGKIVGPWVTDEEEMARKTVIRRARKYWPQSIELATANVHDGRAATLSVEGLLGGAVELAAHPDDDDDDSKAIEHNAGTEIQMPQAKTRATAGVVGDSPRINPVPSHGDRAIEGDLLPREDAADGRTPLTPSQVKMLQTRAKATGANWDQVVAQVDGLYVENRPAIEAAIDAGAQA